MARAAATIKVIPETHARLLEIAKEDNQTIGEVITSLVERYEKERFWDGVSEDLARFRADKDAHQHYRNEFAEWDAQSSRSIAEDAPYFEEGEE